MFFYKTEKEYDVKSTLATESQGEHEITYWTKQFKVDYKSMSHLLLNGKYVSSPSIQVSNGIYFFRIICRLSFKTEPLKIYEEK